MGAHKGDAAVRIIEKRRGYFYGTHKGSTIEIKRESADMHQRFYVQVTASSGSVLVDGWTPEGVVTMAQAKRWAIEGAKL
jgi:hypothetical protein